MSITFKEIKEAIDSGQCNTIYFAVHTKWWTHRWYDLQESNATGIPKLKEMIAEVLDDPTAPAEIKDDTLILLKAINDNDPVVMCAPNGGPVDIITVENFVYIDNPERLSGLAYNKLDIRCHHSNCGGKCFETIEEYGFD